jgi:hypothetical protein
MVLTSFLRDKQICCRYCCGLTSSGAGAAGSEERKRKEFIEKVERGAAFVSGWTPDFFFHPMGFD